MKRIIMAFIAALLIAYICSFAAAGVENEYYDEQLEQSGAVNLFDALGENEKELLKKIGIDSVDFDTVFSASPRKIFDLFFLVIRNEYVSPFKAAAGIAAVIILAAVFGLFVPDDDKSSRIITLIACSIIALSVLVPLSACITRTVSAIQAGSNFMLALIPVLAVVLTVSGSPTLALTYNSLAFTMAQLNVQLSQNIIRPIIQVVLSLSVISTVTETVNFEKMVEFIKRAAIFLMSLSSTVFITMLSLKGMLAASADTVAVRGVRFLIGNLIPVVGGAVSDAYSSIAGSLNLVKNTAAVFAVAAVAVIFLPVLVECICWVFAINLLAMLADMLTQPKLASLLRAISSGVTLLTVTLVFSLVVIVLTIGLIMLIKSSAGG